MSITIQTEGRRTYIAGNTYPHRDAIRDIGAHWDAARKMWWTAKRAAAERLAAQINQAPQSTAQPQSSSSKTPRDGLDSVVAGRVEYKGKTYYLAGRTEHGRTHWDDRVRAVQTQDGAKYLLYFRDGSSQFWAPRDQVSLIKSYDRPQTIRHLKEFATRAKDGSAGTCDECGASSSGLVTCSDSSGLVGQCCQRCAAQPSYVRSFG